MVSLFPFTSLFQSTASRLRRFRFERSKEMTRILVLYYSMYGHIEQMARAIAEGAASVDGVDVTVKRVPELVPREVAEQAGAKLDQEAPFADPDRKRGV